MTTSATTTNYPPIKFVSIAAAGSQIYALSEHGTVYQWNTMACRRDDQWEISGNDTSDLRYWIPLPSPY